MKPAYQDRGKDFVFSFLNSLTFLYAELLGRHYGGGVLELVPSEIARLQIPLVSVTDSQFAQVDSLIRAEAGLDALLDYTDEIVLKEGVGLTAVEIAQIRAAHQRVMRRRLRIAPAHKPGAGAC
jgi:adenine-specific DNA-methyltransferase